MKRNLKSGFYKFGFVAFFKKLSLRPSSSLLKILLTFLCCYSRIIYAQKPEYIHLDPANFKIEKSIFSELEIVDTRFDTVYMGFVQKGALNRKAPIKLTQSMADEVKGSTSRLTTNATKGGETVLINIRNFFLSELTSAMSESGMFIFKAGCYLKTGYSYKFMFSIDTTIVIHAMDVTKKLLRTANEQFGSFVQKAASFDVREINDNSSAYTLYDIQHIDETEKRSIPVYNVDLPQKGLYASFEVFKNNEPTETSFIEEVNKKTKEPVFYRKKLDGSRDNEISRKSFYAACDGSQLYISTEYGIYPVAKKGFDFYFTGKAKETSNTAAVATASLLFGLAGGMLASIPEKTTFEFKIDHITGKFLPIKKISE